MIFFYNISHEHGTKTFSKWSIKKYSKKVPKKKKNKQTNVLRPRYFLLVHFNTWVILMGLYGLEQLIRGLNVVHY